MTMPTPSAKKVPKGSKNHFFPAPDQQDEPREQQTRPNQNRLREPPATKRVSLLDILTTIKKGQRLKLKLVQPDNLDKGRDPLYFQVIRVDLIFDGKESQLIMFQDISRQVLGQDYQLMLSKAHMNEHVHEMMSQQMIKPLLQIKHLAESTMNIQEVDEQAVQHSKSILNCQRLLYLWTRDIIDTLSIHTAQPPCLSKILINEQLDQINQALTGMVNKKRLQFRIRFDKQLKKPVLADGLRIKQIYLHLLYNAIMFSPKDKVLSVKAKIVKGLDCSTFEDSRGLLMSSSVELQTHLLLQLVDRGTLINGDDLQTIMSPDFDGNIANYDRILWSLYQCKRVCRSTKGKMFVQTLAGIGIDVQVFIPIETCNETPQVIQEEEKEQL